MSARYLASCCGPQAMSYRRVAPSSPSSPCAGLRAHGRQCRVVRNRLDRWGGAAEAHHSRRPSPGSPHHLTRTWFAQSGRVQLSGSHSKERVSCPRRAVWRIAQGLSFGRVAWAAMGGRTSTHARRQCLSRHVRERCGRERELGGALKRGKAASGRGILRHGGTYVTSPVSSSTCATPWRGTYPSSRVALAWEMSWYRVRVRVSVMDSRPSFGG